MKTISLLVLALGLCGCSSTGPIAGQNPVPISDERYPYSEIEKVYETVLKAMLPRYFGDDLELAKAHQGKMEQFVRTTLSPARFCELMVHSDETKALFDAAMKDPTVRDTPEFERAFDVTVKVSVQMAMILIAGRFDVYGAKFIHPNETTDYLFSIASGPDSEDLISWVSGEATLEQVRADVGAKLAYEEGDRFFSFGSPQWYWQQLAGRQGYLQVRNNKIIMEHVTFLN